MLLAYLDESARKDHRGVNRYFMGALIVDEHQLRYIEAGLDRVAEMVAHQVPGFEATAELHGYEMFQGQQAWSKVPTTLRVRACTAATRVLADSGAVFILRCVNVDNLKTNYVRPFPEHELALSHALESVQHVTDKDHQGKEPVLVLADEHHTAPDSRSRFKAMRAHAQRGKTSVPLSCLVDTIYFGPSHHSRLLQAVDIATFFKARCEHTTETDSRARQVMSKINEDLQRCCRISYEWPQY